MKQQLLSQSSSRPTGHPPFHHSKHSTQERTPNSQHLIKDQHSNSNDVAQYLDTIYLTPTLTIQNSIIDNQSDHKTIKHPNQAPIDSHSIPCKVEQKSGEKVKGNLKNILTNMRRMFIDFIFKNKPTTRKCHFLQKLKLKECITLGDYELLFSKFSEEIQPLFESKHIQRQIQLSRIKPSLIPVYMKKIKVFQKAFYSQRFPKLS